MLSFADAMRLSMLVRIVKKQLIRRRNGRCKKEMYPKLTRSNRGVMTKLTGGSRAVARIELSRGTPGTNPLAAIDCMLFIRNINRFFPFSAMHPSRWSLGVDTDAAEIRCRYASDQEWNQSQ
jgi:hypothetical protein